jgi:uncharacterized protein involved in type VI secretion and phage assembly
MDSSRFYGKYRGVVIDNYDPKNMGRIKAHIPEVLGDGQTGWALPCVPYAGEGAGVYTVPPPGTGVWIEFEAGDVSHPIWSGCWWGENQLPRDKDGGKATPHLKIFRSENGLSAIFDDEEQSIRLSDHNGSNLITIEVQIGQIKIKAAEKVVLEAPEIELVGKATHPLVLGDLLLQYLNQLVALYQSHLHPGEMVGDEPVTPAPPVPPIPPATPALLSTKVRIE